ncbi:MAG TPA: DUF6496 domain-containing protein [Rhodanobacter sp.]
MRSYSQRSASCPKKTRKAAAKDKKQGKSASTQAGEYVHEEIEHVRKGKHGAKSAKQAIAIGFSKARRAGVKAPVKRTASKSTRKKATSDEAASHTHKKPSATRSKAMTKASKKEGHGAVSKSALSRQAKKSASKRTASSKSTAARKATKTKGAAGRSSAAKKAAKTRAKG